jgi:hypothetical protein
MMVYLAPTRNTGQLSKPLGAQNIVRKNDIPTFNMKVVAQETGLTPDTLRAWERRYGLPSPERTKGGHRLYSQYEIDVLKWLVARQDEGLSISKAVDLWHQLEDKGDDQF